ncbi:filamentous hemagglutinin, partial [Stutzerimonas kirkiae]
EAMVQADPELAWLKEMEQRGDIDWQRVKEVHDSFKYSSSGLGVAAQLVIAIVMAAVVGPMAAGGIGGAATGAVATSAATTGAISVINNRGDLGAVLKDVTSSDALKGYVVSGITAGLTAGVYDGWTGTDTAANSAGSAMGNTGVLANSGTVAGAGLNTWAGVGQFAANQALQNGTSALLNKALGQEGSFSDALQSTLANTFMAAGFNWIGDQSLPGKWDLQDGSVAKAGLHAVMGGLV